MIDRPTHLTRLGRLIKLPSGRKAIELQPASACGDCPAGSGCRAWERAFKLRSPEHREIIEYGLQVPVDLCPGDHVSLELQSRDLSRVAFVLLLLPGISMVAGAWLLDWLIPGKEIWQLAGGGLGLFIGLIPALGIERDTRDRRGLPFVRIRHLENG